MSRRRTRLRLEGEEPQPPVPQNMRRRKCDFAKMRPGDYVSETQHYRVVGVQNNDLVLRNDRGFEYNAERGVVEEGMIAANQYEREQNCSRSDLIDVLTSTGGTVFTVNFNKKPTQESALAALSNWVDGSPVATLNDQASRRELANRMILGEDRTLIGYLVSVETKLGRSKVVDLEVAQGENQFRLVDHRTVNWLIYNNVRYVVQ